MNLSSSVLRLGYGLLRNISPILSMRSTHVISRYDDVKEVLSNSVVFEAPYRKNLTTVMGGDISFILGLPPGKKYDDQLSILQSQIRLADIDSRIPCQTENIVNQLLKNKEKINVVEVIRRATSSVLCEYFGLGADLSDTELDYIESLALNIFKYQFTNDGTDEKSRKLAAEEGAALLAIIDGKIEECRRGQNSPDMLINRYINVQKECPSLTDSTIRAAIFGFVVGGLPQPPMVAPNALNEILKRKDTLEVAKLLVCENSMEEFAALVFEALRFDPLAPLLKRVATQEVELAAGTKRAKTIRENDQLLVMFASAMQDGRRIDSPRKFIASRSSSAYMHFGYGHHECFAKHINNQMIPFLLKPIFEQGFVIRAKGRFGKLIKKDVAFADTLELVRAGDQISH